MNITHSYYYMSFLCCLAIVFHYHLDMSWIEDYTSTLVVVPSKLTAVLES
jgi:hypothetical protein